MIEFVASDPLIHTAAMSIQVYIVASSVLEFNNFRIVLDYTLESLELNCNDS